MAASIGPGSIVVGSESRAYTIAGFLRERARADAMRARSTRVPPVAAPPAAAVPAQRPDAVTLRRWFADRVHDWMAS